MPGKRRWVKENAGEGAQGKGDCGGRDALERCMVGDVRCKGTMVGRNAEVTAYTLHACIGIRECAPDVSITTYTAEDY